MASRNVTKVAYTETPTKVEVEWREANGDQKSLKCSARPRPALLAALAALKPHIAKICELPAKYAEGIEVRGATFSYIGADETMGATITGLRKVATSRSPFVIHTPFLPSDGAEGVPTLDDDATLALLALEEEAFKYVDGDREQVELFADVAAEAAAV